MVISRPFAALLGGLLGAFTGAALGNLLVITSRSPVIGGIVDLVVTFALLGLTWGRRPVAAVCVGAVVGIVAGLPDGLLRVGADPMWGGLVHRHYGRIFIFAILAKGLAVFLLGATSARTGRRVVAALVTLAGWILGTYAGRPFMISERGPVSVEAALCDALGMGVAGLLAGLFLGLADPDVDDDEPAGASRAGRLAAVATAAALAGIALALAVSATNRARQAEASSSNSETEASPTSLAGRWPNVLESTSLGGIKEWHS